jgi:phosphatidylserine/phosphatidylglycerophosphate/cardiolipin synthase-like enzyme
VEPQYAEIVDSKPVQRFLLKFYLSDASIESLILISPIIGTLDGTRVTLDAVCKKATDRGISIYVITCQPGEEYHQRAVDVLTRYDPLELRYNDSLHAKLYLCLSKDESKSFALIGSANLTRHSMENNIEIAMMVYGHGLGRDIIKQLSHWGLERLRTANSTRLVKRIKRSGG